MSGEAEAGKVTVLVVDDEPRVCYLFRRFLGDEDYRVVTANDGSEAVRIATDNDPAVIFLDICMPGMTGIETLQELRSRGQTGAVIILTAHGTVETARQAMSLGAHDYVTKPFNLQLVKALVREVVEERRQQTGDPTCAS